jgi:DNA-binding CsgD family transcriptional regulator
MSTMSAASYTSGRWSMALVLRLHEVHEATHNASDPIGSPLVSRDTSAASLRVSKHPTQLGAFCIAIGMPPALRVHMDGVSYAIPLRSERMWQHVLGARLVGARTFVEVGAVICGYARDELGAATTLVGRFSVAPLLATIVDDLAHATNEDRLDLVRRSTVEPALTEMLASHASVGELDAHWMPLVETGGLIGYVRSEATRSLTHVERRNLDVVGAYASARLAQLGVTARGASEPKLTSRQREIADLAASGYTNREIGDATRTSSNTVKKHLKLVFTQLGVQSRAELATRIAREAHDDGLPIGVSQFGAVWVTKTRPVEISPHNRSRRIERLW